MRLYFLKRLYILQFQLCWTWSYAPADWRLAQVVLIHKKGDSTDLAIIDLLALYLSSESC